MPTIKRTTTRNRSRLRHALINVRDKFRLPSDLITREASIVPKSLVDNEGQRTVDATIASDSAVPIWDPYTYEVIDEVLLPRGMYTTTDVKLLRDHNRYEVLAVLGDVSDFVTTDHTNDATLTFGHELDAQAEAVWNRVAQGFLKTVSAGYAYQRSDSVEIPPGGSATVNGVEFTAGTRMMRVVKKWKLREVSMVVIPADELAQLRSAQSQPDSLGSRETPNSSQSQSTAHEHARGPASSNGQLTPTTERSMHPLLTFLRSLGLVDNATADQIRALIQGLTDAQRAQMQSLIASQGTPAGFPIDAIRSETTAQHATAPASPITSERGQAPAPVQAPAAPAVDPIAQERQRAATIRNMAGDDMPATVIARALDEGMSIEQAGILFANQRSALRPAPLTVDNSQGGQAPFGHVVNRNMTLQSLQAGLMVRENIALDNPVFAGNAAQAMLSRDGVNANWVHQANRQLQATQRMSDDNARAFDAAQQYRHWSMVDFGRAICRMSNINPPDDPTELFERVSSTMNWQNFFTTAMTAQILATYEATPDPTSSFVMETDVPNFLVNERGQLGKLSGMRKDTKNGAEAQHMTGSDRKETFSAERYIGQVEYDDKAFINDQFNVIGQFTYAELGENAKQLAIELVFAILLGNPNMADGNALFSSAHANALSDAAGLNLANLGTAWTAMGTQSEAGKPLGLFPKALVVSVANQWLAEQLVGSVRNTGGSTTVPELNPAFGKFEAIGVPWLDVGCTDHAGNGAAIAGAPNTFFLAAKGGRHTIERAYVKGTGRAPRIMQKELPGARLGRLYMVYLDVAAKALDWRGLLRFVKS